MKELNVVTKDHAYMKLYKPKSAPGEEDKPDFSTQKILATNKKLAMRSVDFSLGEGSIICSYSDKGSELTPEQVRGFSMKLGRYERSFLKKVF